MNRRRKDTNSLFQEFVEWAQKQVLGQPDVFTVRSLLHCAVLATKFSVDYWSAAGIV